MTGTSTLSLDDLPAVDNTAAIWDVAISFLAAEVEEFVALGGRMPKWCGDH
jgi:hypothetical protein